MSDSQGGAGRREVAWRVFAAEFDDATLEHSQSDEERAPNYVVTPTGARVNRLFVVGVLTEVEEVSEDVLRARIVDPTGAFVVYAGQYQPEAKTFLENATPPQFVAVTGKARTFQPEDSDIVYTSIRPESVNAVDAATRDRWSVQTAEQTLRRIATFDEALGLGEDGDELASTLRERDVDDGLAAGIPLALSYYGTTRAYLAELRDLVIDALRVVADEIDPNEVGPLSLDPGEGGDEVDVDLGFDRAEFDAAAPEPRETADPAEATETAAAEPDEEVDEAEATDATAAGAEQPEVEDAEESAEDVGVPTEDAPEVEQEEASVTEEEFEPEEDTDADVGTAGVGNEMYEIDEEERREIEEEYGTDFTSGAEIESPDETDMSEPTPDVDTEQVDEELEEAAETPERSEQADAMEAAPDEDDLPDPEKAVAEADEAAAEETDATPDDLEAVVVERMQKLDDGDGALRSDIVDDIVEDYDLAVEDVEDAIQDALMSGQCYEAGENRLKPI